MAYGRIEHGPACWIYRRIQIFLETPASRTCRFACQGNRQLPGLADSHVRETVSFPDLLIRMSGKPSASRTCGFACQGNRQLPGLAEAHVRGTGSLRHVRRLMTRPRAAAETRGVAL